MQAKLAKWCKRPEKQLVLLQKSNSQHLASDAVFFAESCFDEKAKEINVIDGFAGHLKPNPLKRIISSYNLMNIYSDTDENLKVIIFLFYICILENVNFSFSFLIIIIFCFIS